MANAIEKAAESAENVRKLLEAQRVAVIDRNTAIIAALAAGEDQVQIAAACRLSQATISKLDRERVK